MRLETEACKNTCKLHAHNLLNHIFTDNWARDKGFFHKIFDSLVDYSNKIKLHAILRVSWTHGHGVYNTDLHFFPSGLWITIPQIHQYIYELNNHFYILSSTPNVIHRSQPDDRNFWSWHGLHAITPIKWFPHAFSLYLQFEFHSMWTSRHATSHLMRVCGPRIHITCLPFLLSGYIP